MMTNDSESQFEVCEEEDFGYLVEAIQCAKAEYFAACDRYEVVSRSGKVDLRTAKQEIYDAFERWHRLEDRLHAEHYTATRREEIGLAGDESDDYLLQ